MEQRAVNANSCAPPKSKPQPPTAVRQTRSLLSSRKLYWILGTFGVAGIALSIYYMVYVSSQQDYYNERSFRLLASMGQKLALEIDIVRNVLAAAATKDSVEQANDYLHRSLHGTLEEKDFVVNELHNEKSILPSHEGSLSLFPARAMDTSAIKADYREPEMDQPGKPCVAGSSAIAICATVNLSALVGPAFDELEQGFFQDVLIADAKGDVFYQRSGGGTNIRNLSALIPPVRTDSSNKQEPGNTADKAGSESSPRGRFSQVSQYSNVEVVKLADTTYQLFIEPVPVSVVIPGEEKSQRLVLCGLRPQKHAQAQAMALPHTYLIWAILIILASFTLTWPFLKLAYMSPKERLHARHLLYLLLSVTVGTASVTLIALSFACKTTDDSQSEREIRDLAQTINANIKTELGKALRTLDRLSDKSSGLLDQIQRTASCGQPLHTDNKWNEAHFLENHANLLGASDDPYFRYFFLADEAGCQRLKFTVNPDTTPQVSISQEAYFHPVKDLELSHMVNDDQSGTPFAFRMEPLFSPNTGEFLVILAAPFDAGNDPTLAGLDIRVKALAIRFESLVKTVVPLGYGYVVVNPSGKVLFDSISARNLTEDFTKESRADPAVLALLSQGTSGSVDTLYLGTQKKLWVTPVAGLSDPRLTLVVYKDSAYFTVLNTVTMVMVVVLLSIYALPFWILTLIHLARNSDYPLQGIWPDVDLAYVYFQVFIGNTFLCAVFFLRYGSWAPTKVFINAWVVGLSSCLFALLERASTTSRLIGRTLLVGVLFYLSGWSWMLVYGIAFVLLGLPAARAVRTEIEGYIPLRILHTLFLISLLLVFLVMPACAFFKISYEYAHRLFVQEQQLDLADKLHQRNDNIKSYYHHLNPSRTEALSPLEKQRFDLTWDRYDEQFLNCSLGDGMQADIKPLVDNFLETFILWLTQQLPDNLLTAQLRRLGIAANLPPDISWQRAAQSIRCGKTGKTIPSSQALLLTEASHSGETTPPIVTPYPEWPVLSVRVRLSLSLAIVGLGVWIHFVPSRLFLINLVDLPDLDLWRPAKGTTFVPQNLLVLGHPWSGKSRIVRKISEIQVVDFAEVGVIGIWQIPRPLARVIALNHFEYRIDRPDINLNKLCLLEELAYVEHQRMILLSTIDPMFYLTQGMPAILVAADQDPVLAVQLLDRWAAVLASFRKVGIEDVTEATFGEITEKLGALNTLPEFQVFIHDVVSECDHTAQLRKLGATIMRTHRKGPGLSREALVQELLDRADAYYRVLWSTCTENERVVLYQLAEDGWANFKNEMAILQLKRRKLVTVRKGLCIMNESFRQFVRHSQDRQEINAWEKEGDQSVWKSVKLSLGIVAVLAAAWLFYSQRQFFNSLVAYISAFAASGAVLVKWFADLRGSKAPSGGGTTPE
jgi:hypothetical protein